MGSELLGKSYSLDDKGVGKNKSTPSYTDIFYQCLPHYLSMGMSAYEFWNCDPRMYKVYREKDRIETEKKNETLWLEGMYIYQAILLSAPRLNSIQPKEPLPYPEKPFELGLSKVREEEKDVTEMSDQEIQKTPQYARVLEWALTVNKQKKGEVNAK